MGTEVEQSRTSRIGGHGRAANDRSDPVRSRRLRSAAEPCGITGRCTLGPFATCFSQSYRFNAPSSLFFSSLRPQVGPGPRLWTWIKTWRRTRSRRRSATLYDRSHKRPRGLAVAACSIDKRPSPNVSMPTTAASLPFPHLMTPKHRPPASEAPRGSDCKTTLLRQDQRLRPRLPPLLICSKPRLDPNVCPRAASPPTSTCYPSTGVDGHRLVPTLEVI